MEDEIDKTKLIWHTCCFYFQVNNKYYVCQDNVIVVLSRLRKLSVYINKELIAWSILFLQQLYSNKEIKL